MNQVILIGRLTADPELKFISTGVAISKFTLAIDRTYKKEGASVTDFIPIEIWGKKAEYCATYLGKGYLVAVNGNLHIDRFIDNSGNSRNFAKVAASSVVKLSSPKSASSNAGDTSTASDTSTTDTNSSTSFTNCEDDEVPFPNSSTVNKKESPKATESPPNITTPSNAAKSPPNITTPLNAAKSFSYIIKSLQNTTALKKTKKFIFNKINLIKSKLKPLIKIFTKS